MSKQTAFIYMDKAAVISILSIIDYAHPVLTDVYLHTQLSLVPGATRSCEEMSLSDFLEGFGNPALDLILTNKLQGYWWSIECSLPNGVIMIHSLARSAYSYVYIFKFSPVTGVFSKLVPQEVSDMRAYLEGHPNNSRLFPRVAAPRPLDDKQKLRIQLGGGLGLASRSMTNLVNLLPISINKRISASGISTQIHNFGTALSDGLLNRIKHSIVPTLMSWNVHQLQGAAQALTSLPNYTAPNLISQIDENLPPQTPPKTPTRPRRPQFLRSGSSAYLKHPLQMLRNHGSTISIASQAPSSPTVEKKLSLTTPAITLTTPEKETRILKLKATVPHTIPQSRTKTLWQSMENTLSPKRPDPPTFVFWKDVFEHLSFSTELPKEISMLGLEFNKNINQQVANDLSLLLGTITEMYAKMAEGMQLDFIRLKLPQSKKGRRSLQLRKLHSSDQVLEAKPRESFSTAPETAINFDKKNSESSTRPSITETEAFENNDLGSEAGYRDSITLADESEPTEDEIRIQGQMLANGLKPDQNLTLNFKVSELEFSSILMSHDAYIVEAVLAGWFADAGEWYGCSDGYLINREKTAG
ncbi:hypothetical protein ABW20_dc0100425 [Dactylellina cionopaga]|nr:hypothetical protein ABW20_dc0100425 [Dactylellina cionopaga]